MTLAYYTNDWSKVTAVNLLDLYRSVNWTSYTSEPDRLYEAVQNSTFLLTCFEKDRLIGLLRSLSDNVSINYIQDILVHPEYQGKGIGREMVKRCLANYKSVRMHSLMTDNRPEQLAFYESLGFINIRDTKEYVLNSFLKFKDKSDE